MFAFRRTMVHHRVVVNLDTGRTFSGVLWARRGPLLVLRDVTVHEQGLAPAAVDGEIVVERPRVEFIQVT